MIAVARTRHSSVGAVVAPLLVAGLALSLSGPNLLLAIFAVVALCVGVVLLWRPAETPILLFIFCYQWMQASIAVFHANWLGQDVQNYSTFGGQHERSIALSLAALLALAVGMRLAAGPLDEAIGRRARAIALHQPVSRFFRAYVIAYGVSVLSAAGARAIPALAQPLLAAAGVKWIFFMALAYAAFVRGSVLNRYFVIAFVVEFVSGFGGFFSDFKTVFFFTFFAFFMTGARVSPRTIAMTTAMAALVVLLGVVWTAVKVEYRSYISGGGTSQSVAVDLDRRIDKLAELVSNLDGPALARATDKMIRRISYSELFGVVLNRVPEFTPYENGAITLDAISRPFMPRALFPDKAIIDDTRRTNFYTGGLFYVAQATSISLGYITEMYIDFGEYFMFVAVLAIGYFSGRIFRWLTRSPRCGPLFGMCAASQTLLAASFLESSFTKLFGGLIASVLVIYLTIRYVLPRAFAWIAQEA
ncbi:MAG: hypothetical protein KGL46_12420 [Hyphomicrobiales bacterium]|nr:hypothetical protein [Hyphomicrobiales bacterium]